MMTSGDDERVTSSSRLLAIDDEYRRLEGSPKTTPGWRSHAVDECQVRPDHDFRSHTPTMIIRKFYNLEPMTFTVTLKYDFLAWP